MIEQPGPMENERAQHASLLLRLANNGDPATKQLAALVNNPKPKSNNQSPFSPSGFASAPFQGQFDDATESTLPNIRPLMASQASTAFVLPQISHPRAVQQQIRLQPAATSRLPVAMIQHQHQREILAMASYSGTFLQRRQLPPPPDLQRGMNWSRRSAFLRFPQALSNCTLDPITASTPQVAMCQRPLSTCRMEAPIQGRTMHENPNKRTMTATAVAKDQHPSVGRCVSTGSSGTSISSTAPYHPSSPSLSSVPSMIQEATPEADSWMANLHDLHPCSSIKTTEDDGTVPVFQKVRPDTKTKRFPIGEENVTRYDVLSGRGGKTNQHEGNTKFRFFVRQYKADYLCAKKFMKRQLVCKIVNFVRQGQGRFLQRDASDGCWYEIGDERAYAKVAQSMREGAPVSKLCREFAQQMMSLNGSSSVNRSFVGQADRSPASSRSGEQSSTSHGPLKKRCNKAAFLAPSLP